MFKELFERDQSTNTREETTKRNDSRYSKRSDSVDQCEHSPVREPMKEQNASVVKHRTEENVIRGVDNSRLEVLDDKSKVRFCDLGVASEIMRAIADQGFEYCTPIQRELLPTALTGSDTTGKAQTGTGKTAAFLIAIYEHLIRNPSPQERLRGMPRVLILAPTRELVLQLEKDALAMGKYTDIKTLAVLGGVGYNRQKQTLKEKAIDILIATPGRLLDFHRQRRVDLCKVEILVIDEADRMLDMGFIPDVQKILQSTPPRDKRQTMFFSATLTPEVERLVEQWTRNPVHVEIAPSQVASKSIHQLVYLVTAEEKFPVLANLIIRQNLKRSLVFTNRKDQANRLANRLKKCGITCAVFSGDIPQKQRIKTLENFRKGKIRVMVATDVAARGLHIENISHVVNFTLPRNAEDYVHRIGRTGRAGALGISVSFACEEDSFYIPSIEEYLGHSLNCVFPDKNLLRHLAPRLKGSSGGNIADYQRRKRQLRKGLSQQAPSTYRGQEGSRSVGKTDIVQQG